MPSCTPLALQAAKYSCSEYQHLGARINDVDYEDDFVRWPCYCSCSAQAVGILGPRMQYHPDCGTSPHCYDFRGSGGYYRLMLTFKVRYLEMRKHQMMRYWIVELTPPSELRLQRNCIATNGRCSMITKLGHLDHFLQGLEEYPDPPASARMCPRKKDRYSSIVFFYQPSSCGSGYRQG